MRLSLIYFSIICVRFSLVSEFWAGGEDIEVYRAGKENKTVYGSIGIHTQSMVWAAGQFFEDLAVHLELV